MQDLSKVVILRTQNLFCLPPLDSEPYSPSIL